MKDHLKSSITVVVIGLCTLVAIVGLGIGAWVLSVPLEPVDIGEPTMPAPFYLVEDVQYYTEAPELQLKKEADAMQSFRTEQAVIEEAD